MASCKWKAICDEYWLFRPTQSSLINFCLSLNRLSFIKFQVICSFGFGGFQQQHDFSPVSQQIKVKILLKSFAFINMAQANFIGERNQFLHYFHTEKLNSLCAANFLKVLL